MVTPWFTVSIVSILLFCGVLFGTFAGLLAVLRKAGGLSSRAGVILLIGLSGFASILLILAQAELFLSFSLPPRPLIAAWTGFGVLLFLTRRTAMGEALESLPIGYLVLLQSFRLPLELVMHRLAGEGVMPNVMSYSGRNWDIASGILALIFGIGLLRFQWPRWTAWIFGAVGTGLLLNVVLIAARTMPGSPMPLAANVPNVWVAYPPFVLLPGLLVPFAAWLHYRIFLALLSDLIPAEFDT